MINYDFDAYFAQLKAAQTAEARQAVRQREQAFVASLSESEQQEFKIAFEQYIKDEIVRFRRMADQAEDMFGVRRNV